jgi:hypothetical protein
MPPQPMPASQTSSPESAQQLSLPYSHQEYGFPSQDPFNMLYAMPSSLPLYSGNTDYVEPTATSMLYSMGNGITQNDGYSENYYSHGHQPHGHSIWNTTHYY